MEPLEQVTVLMTLMKRLAQVMDHERTVLRSMQLDALPEIQDEKEALAEAYEIEIGRLRCSPETIARLDVAIRHRLNEAMRSFQESVAANLDALLAAQSVVDRVQRNISDSLARSAAGFAYSARNRAEPGGQVISIAFDRKL